jgi:hypothetical protein
MKNNFLLLPTAFIVGGFALGSCAPAVTPVPPTATLRPSDTPLPPTASPTPTGVSFVSNGQQLNRLAGVGVALADLDGDGDLDAFVVNAAEPDGQGDRVYFGDDRGQFSDSGQVLIDPSGWAGKPVIDDIDGDGRLEAITGRTVWLSDGRGHFTASTDRFEDSDQIACFRIQLADLDGDGRPDIVATIWNGDSGNGHLRVYRNDGQGRFHDTGQKVGGGMIAHTVLGDLDGNGTIDAATFGWRANTVIPGAGDYCPNRVWLNDGKGNLKESGNVLDEGSHHIRAAALGDLNGDGHPDLVLGMNSASRAGQIYLNDGQGRFTAWQNLDGTWAQGVALGDFNGDGSPDVFLACGMTPERPPSQVWLNNGQGIFLDSGVRLVNNAISESVALGDFNGDGKLDAFVTNADFVPDGTGSYVARA